MKSEGKVTVLLSGRGSNLKALIQQQHGFHIRHVISDKADAEGLEVAREAHIPTTIITRGEHPSPTDFKAALLRAVESTAPDVVALAGFMVVVQRDFVERFHGRLINIHPSLLPHFAGLRTYARALEAKHLEHGCTVHFVDTGVDTGPIIAQAKVPVLSGDTPDTLAARVIIQEHALYPWIVRNIVQGDIQLQEGVVRYSPAALAEAHARGYTTFG
jgi:phosphoribosylglycinamide formyltransferase-1